MVGDGGIGRERARRLAEPKTVEKMRCVAFGLAAEPAHRVDAAPAVKLLAPIPAASTDESGRPRDYSLGRHPACSFIASIQSSGAV